MASDPEQGAAPLVLGNLQPAVEAHFARRAVAVQSQALESPWRPAAVAEVRARSGRCRRQDRVGSGRIRSKHVADFAGGLVHVEAHEAV